MIAFSSTSRSMDPNLGRRFIAQCCPTSNDSDMMDLETTPDPVVITFPNRASQPSRAFQELIKALEALDAQLKDLLQKSPWRNGPKTLTGAALRQAADIIHSRVAAAQCAKGKSVQECREHLVQLGQALSLDQMKLIHRPKQDADHGTSMAALHLSRQIIQTYDALLNMVVY